MRQSPRINPLLLAFVLVPSTLASSRTNADQPVVQFDLPTTAVATACDDPELVKIELRLSSMIESPESPPISQWMIRCVPRDQSVRIADYAPRTETGSDVSTPIKIKTTAEESKSTGISVDAAYAHLTHANFGADRGTKNSDIVEFDRIAPVQAVTASGTIHRGQGVYFKLRWTATQVLEGEKLFHITLHVPEQWRGGLMDVSVVAQSGSTSSPPWNLAPWDRDPKTIGQANFVVALYRSGDAEAERLAQTISEAERKLRELSKQELRSSHSNTLPSVLRSMATKLDLVENERDHIQWVQRLLMGFADPYFDKQIGKLPMPVRIAVLDYVDLRNEFNAMTENLNPSVIAAKPAL